MQDITKINKYIVKHNKRIEGIKKKVKKFKKDLASKTGKNVKGMTLTAEEIQELSKKRIKHDDRISDDEEDSEARDLPPEEEEKVPINKNDEEDLDYPDDEEIEDGGEEEKGNATNRKFDGAPRSVSSKVPQKPGEKVFQESGFRSNIFGRAASVIIHDEEISYDGDYSEQVKATKKFKLIYNWKKEMNAVSAFFRGKLRPNDYHIVISWFLTLITYIVLAAIMCAIQESVEGITWFAALCHVSMSYGIIVRAIAVDAETNVPETILYILSHVLFYAWGFADFAIRFDFKADEDNQGDYFLVWYVTFIPFFTLTTVGLYKWYDANWKFGNLVIFSLAFGTLAGIGCLVCCFVFIGPVSGAIILGILIIILYIAVIIRIYLANDRYLPKWWRLTNFIVLSIVALTALIVSIAVDGFNSFLGWSITYGIFAGLILFYGISDFANDILNSENEPIFFSPWIFPVFKYIPKKNDIAIRNQPAATIIVFFFLALLWSLQCTVWITPYYYGVALSCLVEVTYIVFVLYVVSFTPALFEDVKSSLDQLLVKRAWLEAKTDYVQTKSITTPESMITFEEVAIKRDQIVTHLNNLKKDPSFAKQNHACSWNTGNIDTSSLYQCRKFLYRVEKEKTTVYIDELSLLIHFELLLILHAKNLIKKDRKFLFKFIEVKGHALTAADIHLSIPSKGKPEFKHAQVLTQINKLAPEKLVLFRQLKEAFVQEELEKEDAIREQERLEQERDKERQERLAELSDAKRKLLENLDPNMPIDEMPDCQMKYEKILKQFSENGTKFTDNQFTASNQSLGDGCLNRGVAKWVRASEVEGCVLYRGDVDARDVVQGALGDCYFLSAMSVLGGDNVKKVIRFTDVNKTEEWQSGAFMIRFFKNGQVEYVIIDDYFPVLGNGEFAFAKGGPDGKELWPMVIEKAYAKLNGSYNYIEAGKVQYALADMTGGVSEQIDLKKDAANQDALWERIKALRNQGALMGAGSPENALGDRAINEYGIVQGHAYAVLNAVEVDSYKLISLRNPHGNRGVEWNGDWCDDSDMWTQRAKNKCNFVDAVDGVFWMELGDFCDNYSFLYICRILKNWNKQEIDDEWKGSSAEGLPSSKNRTAKLELNPQYELKISSPGPLFIQMSQYEKVNMFKGKHFIMFFIQHTGGGKIVRMERSKILGMSGQPTNLNIVSSEINLTSKQSYPLTVTLLTANTEHGAEGEAKYGLKVYCMPSFTMKRL